MFRLNFKIAFRNLWKNKGYAFINILGLSIGMMSCILIFIFIRHQLSFDRGYKNEDRIYRFVTDWKYSSFEDHTQGVPVPLPDAARNEFAAFEKVAPITKSNGVVRIKDEYGKDIVKMSKEVYYTEPDFFDIFDIGWIAGKPKEAIKAPNTVALSASTAKLFFGTAENAMGKSIFLGRKTILKVTGVFKDLPGNSSFTLNIVVSNANNPNKKLAAWDSVSSNIECYVLLKAGVALSDLDQPLQRFNDKYYKRKNIAGNQKNALQALKDIHFSDRYGNFAERTVTKKEIYGLAIIGLFLILTACINFINLATAQAINRSKEVGVRKVMGSKRKQLVLQFLTETFCIIFLALLIACVLTEFALPQMEQLFKARMSFSLLEHPVIFVFLLLLVALVSLLAGFYPALVMSGFSPALAIKNKVTVNSGSLSLRKVLVVVQFSITIILVISTLKILQQMKYIREKPLGFNKEAVAMIYVPGDSLSMGKFDTFKERALRIPGVKMLSFGQKAPLSMDMQTTNFSYNGKENKDFELRLYAADEDYFKLFELKFIAGKAFRKSDTISGYVVNQTFLKKINILKPEDVLGKIIDQNGRKAPIVGVLKDFNDQSLQQSISPLAIYSEKDNYYRIAVKIDGKQVLNTMEKVENLWNSTFPEQVYHAQFIDDAIHGYYENERVMGVLFRVFAGVIIFISFIGLFGLISFVAAQRTKEVAIRKVLGASTLEVVKMLNSSFLIMVFIANLLAWPLAYLFVSKWLSGFAYRTEISIWPFVLAMFISMLLTLITVSIRSYKAAVTNTIDALKYE
jgi:putative ABC transport system permease protein